MTTTPPREQLPPLPALTDERIDNLAELTIKSMPDGLSGFLKTWGWRQFAKALLGNFNSTMQAYAREALRAQAASVVPGMRDERYFLEGIIDIWDDSDKHPDHRVYVAGALGEVIEEARALLSTTPAHILADVEAMNAKQYQRIVALKAALAEALEYQSAPTRPSIHVYGRWRRLHDNDVSPPQAPQAVVEVCEWRGDEDGLWFSACGGDPWTFEDGGPTENKKRFCIHCGKRLTLATKGTK